MYKRLRRHRHKKNNTIIVITSLCLLLTITVGYAAFQTNLSITAKGNIKEKSRVIQSWDYTTTDQDFHTDFYRENILTITFLDNNNVPSNATESWNVSEDKENGGVMAWVIPSSNDNTKYDLYIGAKGGVIANVDSSAIFFNFKNCISINFNHNYDTSNTINMYYMFGGESKFKTLDLSDFNTSNVTNMSYMFTSWSTLEGTWKNSELTNIIFGENFDTSKVTTMRDMFSGLNNIISLDLSTFDTSNVTSMFHMFWYSKKMEEINLCSFNTYKVTTMESMFAEMPALKIVKVGPNWTTAYANTDRMFNLSGTTSVTTGSC